MEETMNNFSNTARINMLQEHFDDSVLVSNNIWNDLLLLSIDQQLDDFAEITRKHRVDWLAIFIPIYEFEKTIK